MKKVLLISLLNFLFLSCFSQKTNYSINDSINMSKSIKVEQQINKSKKTVILNSILGSLFTITGVVFTAQSIKDRNNAEKVRFITLYSSSSSEWSRDLRYSYKNYEEYSRYVTYQNSIFNDNKNQLLKDASKNQLIGLFSFLGTGYTGIRVILSLNNINHFKFELNK